MVEQCLKVKKLYMSFRNYPYIICNGKEIDCGVVSTRILTKNFIGEL